MAKVIETYWDPQGCMGGKPGCWKARFQNQHTRHDAGRTMDEAIRELIQTVKRFGLSGERSDYDIVARPDWPYDGGEVEASLSLWP